MPTEQEVSIDEFRRHLQDIQVTRRIDEVVVHHTWRPTAADYRGIETVRAVRRYHMQVRGWSDNGYHVMIGPDGAIFLCRPIRRSGAHVSGRNAHTVGVAFIANFDREEPTQYPGMETGYQVIAALLRRFKLDPTAIRFHREFASKTCPGLKLDLADFREEVGRRVAGEEWHDPKRARLIVGLPNNETAEPLIVDGQHYISVRDAARLCNCDLIDHRRDHGKLYLVAREDD